MRLKIALILTAGIMAVITALPAQAAPAPRQMSQGYSISIIVDCLDEAVAVLRGLPGHDLQANISMGHASFTRRVDNHLFRHVQAVLRELGEVTHESEFARHLGGELMNLDTRIRVMGQEIERLTALMAASTTLDVLIAVDNQLSWVSWERSNLIGRRNLLLNNAATTLIDINLFERGVYEPPEEQTFGQRVGAAFNSSWRGLLRFGGNAVVLLARIGLPLAVWAVIVGGAVLIILRIVKRHDKKREVMIKDENATAEGENDYVQ